MKKEIDIYFFDMDHTLIDNDCDVSWKQFVVKHDLGPSDSMEKAEMFFEDYRKGTLDFNAFISFQLAEFKDNTEIYLAQLAQQHFDEFVSDKIYPEARALIQELQAQGKMVVVLTSTNRVLAAPTARALGIKYLLAADLEVVKDNWYSGFLRGEYPVGQGKVEIARKFCAVFGKTLDNAAYYGDAIQDQYLLDQVAVPMVVNPHPVLAEIAEKKKWPVLQWTR